MLTKKRYELYSKVFLFYFHRFDNALKSKNYDAMDNSGKKALWFGKKASKLEHKLPIPRITTLGSLLRGLESAYDFHIRNKK